MIRVTDHAAQRYCERVEPALTPVQAIAAILTHAPAIEQAAAFGAKCIILGSGARLRLDGEVVKTVLGRKVRGRLRQRVGCWEARL